LDPAHPLPPGADRATETGAWNTGQHLASGAAVARARLPMRRVTPVEAAASAAAASHWLQSRPKEIVLAAGLVLSEALLRAVSHRPPTREPSRATAGFLLLLAGPRLHQQRVVLHAAVHRQAAVLRGPTLFGASGSPARVDTPSAPADGLQQPALAAKLGRVLGGIGLKSDASCG